jgi:hypothetical protein
MEQTAETAVVTTEVEQNWEVFGADGQLVGHVNEVHANYVWVQKGLLFPQDMYIPDTAFERLEPGRLLLKVTSEEVIAAGWDTLPEAITASTPIGVGATAPTLKEPKLVQ